MILALLHTADLVPMGVIQRLDAIIYDARLRPCVARLPFDPPWDGATSFETK